ncbi:reactive intermediate/imine deaminase [Oryzomonas sagensis]|uniref:Reactive intermediate/imine deaminase n=1 Tax=Oryzomonas sagensis TaxID=2603857 RepID=A0ABQ6TL54_9BACT|nr:Rid family detoxifying hydrolase [Oryzomonas sagensis]KAB0668994.1 reactive intermediate/imine deaminase [Oryzomonas sagensis]
MTCETIATDKAPAAIGPYAQAIRANGLLFCSGQIALDPATGELATGGVAAETERVMANIAAVLAAAGVGLSQVVKTTIFLADMGDFAVVNEIYGRCFGNHKPARSTVAVKSLPRGALVEIEIVALA